MGGRGGGGQSGKRLGHVHGGGGGGGARGPAPGELLTQTRHTRARGTPAGKKSPEEAAKLAEEKAALEKIVVEARRSRAPGLDPAPRRPARPPRARRCQRPAPHPHPPARRAQIEAGRGARAAVLSADELLLVKNLGLLTLKPLIYAGNVGEDDLGNQGADNVHVQVRAS